MTDAMKIKRGDLLPPLKITLTDGEDAEGNPIPVNLTTATTVRVIGWRNNAPLFNRTATSTNAQGEVTMNWQATDTDTVADLYIEVEVTWPGTLPQTFPPEDYMVVHVSADLS